jgi:hypothetical protein
VTLEVSITADQQTTLFEAIRFSRAFGIELRLAANDEVRATSCRAEATST